MNTDQTDSAFLKTQKMIQKKNETYFKELNDKFTKESLRIRLSNTIRASKETSIWKRFLRWLKLK